MIDAWRARLERGGGLDFVGSAPNYHGTGAVKNRIRGPSKDLTTMLTSRSDRGEIRAVGGLGFSRVRLLGTAFNDVQPGILQGRLEKRNCSGSRVMVLGCRRSECTSRTCNLQGTGLGRWSCVRGRGLALSRDLSHG